LSPPLFLQAREVFNQDGTVRHADPERVLCVPCRAEAGKVHLKGVNSESKHTKHKQELPMAPIRLTIGAIPSITQGLRSSIFIPQAIPSLM